LSSDQEAKRAEAYLSNKPFKTKWFVFPYKSSDPKATSVLLKEEEYPEYIPIIGDMLNTEELMNDEKTFVCFSRIYNQATNTLELGFVREDVYKSYFLKK
jgi:hypothetical protein